MPVFSATRIPWWLWANVLSLDAPLVAVLWQAALAQVCGVVLPPACHLALGLAVWLIYVMDRVLEGFAPAGAETAVTARHAFYRRFRWVFLLVLAPAGAVWLLVLAFTALPEGILWRGLGLGPVVGVYLIHFAAPGRRLFRLVAAFVGLLLVYFLPVPLLTKLISIALLLVLLVMSARAPREGGFRLLPKELFCGYLFAAGCALSVNFYSMDASAGPLSFETLLLAVLCTVNCIAIAYFERDADAASGRRAITLAWPEIGRAYPMLLFGLGAVIGSMMSRDLSRDMVGYVVAVLASLVLLGLVYRLARRLSPELSHVLADVAVALPLGLLLLLD